MALQKQVVGVDFTQGLDKHTDERLATKLTMLQNGVLDDRNTIQKAGGYTGITTTAKDSTAIAATIRSLAVRKSSELLVENNDRLHAVLKGGTVAAAGTMTREQQFTRCSVSAKGMFEGFGSVKNFDFANGGGEAKASCWVWNDNSGTNYLSYCLVDDTTGAVYKSAYVPLGATAGANTATNAFKVVYDSTNSVFRIFVVKSDGAVGHYAVDPANPNTTPTEALPYGAGTADTAAPCLDAVFHTATGTMVAYRLAGTFFYWASLFTGATVSYSVGNASPVTGLAIQRYSGGNVGVFWTYNAAAAGTDYVQMDVYSSTLTGFVSASVVSAANRNPGRIVAYPTDSDTMVLAWNEISQTVSTSRIYTATCNTTPAVTIAATTIQRGLSLASKVFKQGSNYFVGAYLPVADQSTLYIIGLDGTTLGVDQRGVVARILYGVAGNYSSSTGFAGHYQTPNVAAHDTESEAFVLPGLRRGSFSIVGGVDVSESVLTRFTVRFGRSLRPLQNIEAADSVIFAGASPLMFDGQVVCEAGFQCNPEGIPSITSNAAGGSKTPGATYGVAVNWEYADAHGRLWRSGAALSSAVMGGGDTRLVPSVPYDRWTRRRTTAMTTPGTLERVVVYCTAGEVFYKESYANANTPAADTVSVNLDTADSDITANSTLYTEGDVPDNEPLPGFRVGCLHQGRLFMGACEDPFEVRYTHFIEDGFGLETNSDLYLKVPETCGEVTALASMDNKLIIFCERGIWCVFGEGPNRLGVGNSYSDPQLVDSTLGCRMDSPDSVVLTPQGLWFRAQPGFRLLAKNLQVAAIGGQYIGSEVDSLVDGCVGAVVEPGKSLVKFYTGTIVLVFDHQHGQWSTFTNHTCTAAVLWQSLATFITSAGAVRQAGGSTHNGAAIALTVETSWIKFAGVQGLQRIYEVLVLGQYKAASTLQLQVGVDYSSSYTSAVTVDLSTITSGGVYQVRHRPTVQKCEAMRFKISETGGSGDGFALTNLSVVAGIKRGGMKLSTAKNI